MIKVKLRQKIEEYKRESGERLTYSDIADQTGLSKATLEALGSRDDYNATLSTIDSLCAFFKCDVDQLLQYEEVALVEEPEESSK